MALVVGKGWETKFGIGLETTEGTAVDPTVALEIASEDVGYEVGNEQFPGVNGSRVEPRQNDVLTTLGCKENWQYAVQMGDIDMLLYLITGQSSSTYVPATSVPSFTCRVDKSGIQFRHTGCKINKATFEASQTDQILKANIEAIGMAEDKPVSGTSTIPDPPAANQPFLFRQLTLTVDSTAYNPTHLRMAFSNNLIADVFRNSQTRLATPEGIAALEGEIAVDYNADNDRLYEQFKAGTWGALNAVFDDGTHTITFDFPHIRFTDGAIHGERNGAVLLTLPFRAKSTGPAQTDLYSVYVS